MMKALDYANFCIKSKQVPKYVKKQAKEFIAIAKGKDDIYFVNEKKLEQIEKILKMLNMPKGIKAGHSLYEVSCGYQWLLYTAVLCVVRRDDHEKRKYELVILEIARKNFKTYTIATLFILLFLLEPKFSKFYSVAPDGQLSKEVKDAISDTLKASPYVYLFNGNPRFKILRDCIKFNLKESVLTPLSYSTSRMDGRLPNAWLADEVGALPNRYPLDAMRSGQLAIKNKLGFIISTKYNTSQNPFEDEVSYAKKALDKIETNDSVFALLYEPDNPKKWMTDDIVLQQSNPVSLEIPEIWEDLLKKRALAISMESTRENFMTKHCNIIYQGVGTQSYIDINDVLKCRVSHIDWTGRNVYLGVDLAMTNDNCSVAMVAEEDGKIFMQSVAFIPSDRILEKTQYEKVDYNRYIEKGWCYDCGSKVVDYGFIEKYVFDIEEKYGVNVVAIGYDRYNALSSAQKWSTGDDGKYKAYNCVQVRQHSDTLHAPTKFLKEKILSGEVEYEENNLLEINFENARCVYDNNMNLYVNKKKSNGKVDMVVSILNALYLLQQDVVFSDGFIVQTL